MLGDWAGVGNDDNGVSIENAFANYDRSLPPSAPLPLFLSLPLLSLVCLLFSSLLCCLSPSPVSPPSLPLPSLPLKGTMMELSIPQSSSICCMILAER
jgi:hypothetical protein